MIQFLATITIHIFRIKFSDRLETFLLFFGPEIVFKGTVMVENKNHMVELLYIFVDENVIAINDAKMSCRVSDCIFFLFYLITYRYVTYIQKFHVR